MKLLHIFKQKLAQLAIKSLAEPARNTWHSILEPFAGAWQRGIHEDASSSITYPTLFACIHRISSDISKLNFRVVAEKNGIQTVTESQLDEVLQQPNHYQNEAQFREYWLLSKLITGNTYILKQRNKQGNITGLYVLDPQRVTPMVTDSGSVYYQLTLDKLNKLANRSLSELIVPASEIIHDRLMPITHPLIGIPPVTAANWASVKNLKIIKNATDFFANSSQPSGLLTAPVGMSKADADKVKHYWENEFSGGKNGNIAIIGADMKFTPFSMKSIDSQMLEQMKYSDEQICQPFGIPPFKVGIGNLPSGLSVYDLNLLYWSDALQSHIQAIEMLLNQHLRPELGKSQAVQINIDLLLKMDESTRADIENKLVNAKIKTPNEAREAFNLMPIDGGGILWGQQQDYPLSVLAQRQGAEIGAGQTLNEPPSPPEEVAEVTQVVDEAVKTLMQQLKQEL